MTELLKNINEDFFIGNDSDAIQQMIEHGVIEKEVIDKRWLGFKPATEEQIECEEKRLDIKLPPSYRSFLLASNGFRFVSPFLNNLFPIEKVNWTKNTEQRWLSIIENFPIEISDDLYFMYDDEQNSVLYRPEYFRQSLKISEWYDGMCVFLNPVIRHGEEWEVMEYATWYPGTTRYKSFEEYLQKVHESNLSLRNR